MWLASFSSVSTRDVAAPTSGRVATPMDTDQTNGLKPGGTESWKKEAELKNGSTQLYKGHFVSAEYVPNV
jgi:hypothetical protein